ncbi:sodium-dependent glucose transporter 1B-like isoform X2 [Pecten maximus]|uniref:sodium-dependent glucose transporter 1B-like isoform X2 n=1 Tax=Pecten maximus TaxID=6579 RepID=UPI001458105E|nr:sodium-dependent glucose transporter 1B-like isoform X2 [Pecten maximus]
MIDEANGCEGTENIQGSVCGCLGVLVKKLTNDPIYREKCAVTLCIYICFVVMGGVKGTLGPALTDLTMISQADTGTLIVTFLYVGLTIGSLLSGVIYHRINHCLLFAACSLLEAVITAAIPWCYVFHLMLGSHLLVGFAQGIADTAGNTEIIQLWSNDGGTKVVGLHLMFNFGGVVFPIIIAPFLVNKKDIQSLTKSPPLLSSNDTYTTASNQFDVATLTGVNVISGIGSQSFSPEILQTSTDGVINATDSTEREINLDLGTYTSRVYVAYLISACLFVVISIFFIGVYCSVQKRNCSKKEISDFQKPVIKDSHTEKINGYLKCIVLSIMVTIATISRAIDNAFAAYLTTFCTDTLGLTPQQGSFVTSLYFVFVVIGLAFGTALTKLMTTLVYEGIQIGLMVTALVLLTVSASYLFSTGVWISASLLGFGKSVALPLTLSWTNDSFLKINGKLASVFFTSTMIASTTNPLLLGFLMENFTNMWFCYLLLIESCILITFCVFAVIMTNYIRKYVRVSGEDIDKEIHLNEDMH